MTSRPLGPQDLKQLGPLPPDSRLKGTVKLVKHLKPSECLEFCLDLADNSPGPFKRARVAVTTGIRNAGMNVEPLLRAEAALNKAMAAGHKVVLHTGLPGCILRKHEIVQKQGRREVELVLENGSKIEIVGTDDVVDFYRGESTRTLDIKASVDLANTARALLHQTHLMGIPTGFPAQRTTRILSDLSKKARPQPSLQSLSRLSVLDR